MLVVSFSPIDGVFVSFERVRDLSPGHDVAGGVVVRCGRGRDGRVVIVHRVVHVRRRRHRSCVTVMRQLKNDVTGYFELETRQVTL